MGSRRGKHNKNTPEQAHSFRTEAIATCAVHGGKKLWVSRRLARRAVRTMYEPGLREYRCDVTPGMWHIGHLPTAVKDGRRTSEQFYDARPGR